MSPIDVCGLKIDPVTKQEFLNLVSDCLRRNEKKSAQVSTVYSEFVVFAQNNQEFKDSVNSSYLSVADGIGIVWASDFLSRAAATKLRVTMDFFASIFSLLFNRKKIFSLIKERLTGRLLIYDLASLASREGYSLALVGGRGGVAENTAQVLKSKYPDLKINMALSDCRFDDDLVRKIYASNSDILLIAYQPPMQEIWLNQNAVKLNVNLSMGLGGTFDYLAGKAKVPPRLVHKLGLEWLWRLITQPARAKRIWNATYVFLKTTYIYKLSKLI